MNLSKWIDITQAGPTSSPSMQLIANDCWSYFGTHEREDVKKKLAEQPRLNPTNPRTLKSGGGSY